jgi:hypothetical protein
MKKKMTRAELEQLILAEIRKKSAASGIGRAAREAQNADYADSAGQLWHV